jgi:hypothetical protein
MGRPSGLEVGFPHSAGDLLDRLGSLYGLDGELERPRRVLEPLPVIPLEASVSLGARGESPLRLTLGLTPTPDDPEARAALTAALSGLGVGGVAGAADEALASLGASIPEQRLARSLGLRARRGEPPRPRPGARVGGATESDRSARMANAMRAIGLDDAAAAHLRLARSLAANPFNAVIPYGLAFDVALDRLLGAKTYFCCEWADAAVGLLRGRLAAELELDGVECFERLVSCRQARQEERWMLEVSFELPADPARSVRAKIYLPPARLAGNEVEGHDAALGLAARLGLDPRPYQELLAVLRPDGLTPERACSLMVGVSASAEGSSLEVYIFDPRRADRRFADPHVDA